MKQSDTATHRVLVNVAEGESGLPASLHQTERRELAPWLLHGNHDEVRTLLNWGNVSAQEMDEHELNIRRWGTSTVVWLTHRKLAQLIDRGKRWPWNGYELRTMKQAGKYPPKRLSVHGRVPAEDRR